MKKTHIFLTIILLAVAIAIWLISFSNTKDNDLSEIVRISFRDVGNSLLLTKNDSSSLILPITKVNTSTYQIAFDNALSFNPDDLVRFTKESFQKANLPNDYRVEVLQCKDLEVAYSYQMTADEEATIIPCAGRKLPLGCYLITVKFLDTTQLPTTQKWIFVAVGMMALLMIWFAFKHRQSNLTQIDTEAGYTLGSYQFYPEQNKLVKSAIEINLSKKECEILEIFVANKNQIIKRDELTKKVWEDNGVIVGRSLDTYVSKLRKKLKEDTSVKLTNIHGIGYKLEID